MTADEDARGFNPVPTRRWYRDSILPRSIRPLAWVYAVALLPSRLAGATLRRQGRHQRPRVAIESGIVGWTHVFFEELEQSAIEEFGAGNVVRHVIDRSRPYLPQLLENLERDRPTHVVLDVRTPSQSWRASLREAFMTAAALLRRGIVPIVILTDAYYRRQRWQAAVLTSWSGVVVTFTAVSILRPIFPHGRIIGPLFMPISERRMRWLGERKSALQSHQQDVRVQFVGSVYPPRDRFLEECGRLLEARGIRLVVNGDKPGTSNEDYWTILLQSDIVLTTTLQGPGPSFMDWIWVQQAVFRYSEALACSAALVAGHVDGGFPYFEDGRDYLGFQGVTEAVAAIERLVKEPETRRKLAEHGHATVASLVESHAFWRAIDSVIGVRT